MPTPDWNTPFYQERSRRTGRNVYENMLPQAAMPPQFESPSEMLPEAPRTRFDPSVGVFLAETQGSEQGIPLWLRDQLATEMAMQATDRSIQAQQALGPQKARVEPFTLTGGQTRFGPEGRPIASLPPTPLASSVISPYQQEQIRLSEERNELARQRSGRSAATMKPSDYRGILTEVRTFANQAINTGDPNYIQDEQGQPIGIEGIMDRVLQRDYGMTLEQVRKGAAMKVAEPAAEPKPAVAPVSTPETRAARQVL